MVSIKEFCGTCDLVKLDGGCKLLNPWERRCKIINGVCDVSQVRGESGTLYKGGNFIPNNDYNNPETIEFPAEG